VRRKAAGSITCLSEFGALFCEVAHGAAFLVAAPLLLTRVRALKGGDFVANEYGQAIT
jgi:hypothetical protein